MINQLNTMNAPYAPVGNRILQALPAMAEGGLIADVIPAIASIDPVLGGVDR